MRFFSYLKKGIPTLLLACGISTAAMAVPMNGIYTIGGTSPSYATLSAAVSALVANGVSGPVTFNIRNGNYSGTTWRAAITTVTGASATNRITFKSETNNAANVTITVNGTASASNYVLKLDDASYITIKDLTFKNGGATYGRVLQLNGTSSHDSIVNCKLTSITRTSSSTNTALLYASSLKSSGNVFLGNTFLNNSYGAYYYGTSTTTKFSGDAFINNTFTNQYSTGAEIYYSDDLKFNDNVITTNSTATFYGLETRYADGALQIVGNKISGFEDGYGLYIYYSDATAAIPGLIANNVIFNSGGNGTARGIQNYYSSYQRIYNNTVNISSTSATAAVGGYFYYSSATYSNNEIRNNVFANTGGGYAMYVYKPLDYDNTWDYNNLFTTGAKLVDQGSPSTDYASLTAWRAATSQDMNSISYDPAFSSSTALAPDPSNPASWSLNGRGIHLAGNNKDVNGTVRVVDPANGVPDIGAYEFVPTVTPPVAIASPLAPAAGTTQVFTFGEDTVAKIEWAASSAVPASITVKQYTGTLPAGISSISTTSMYFYTDIAVPSATYNHATEIYYKEPWMGTTVAEVALRLAKKEGSNPWGAYPPAVSSSKTDRNVIRTTGLTDFGLFTGIDVSNNASAEAVLGPSGYFCSGTYPVQVRIKNNGNNAINQVEVHWQVDGVLQPTINYNTTLGTKANATISLGNVTFANGYHTIKAWTSLPNNVADPLNADDTTTITLRDGLNGTYTVGGVTPSYTTVTDAVDALNKYGICGSVTFNIRNGNYSGQAIINKVNGASATNRVVFQSETGNAANVNINYAATSTADNYVMQLNDASYITFRNLSFTANGTADARVMQYISTASYDSIINCTLTGPVLTTASTNTALFFADDLAGKDNVFTGNTFQNGSYGLYYRGTSSTTVANGVVFEGNTFENQYTYAFYPAYTKDVKFNNNIIVTNSTDNAFYGVYTYYCDGGLEITRNKISGLQGGYGVYVYYCDATSANKGLIANNTIAMGAGTNTVYALRVYNSNYQGVYNNSVNVIAGSATGSYAGYFYSSSTTYQNVDVKNNVFANHAGGYAVYVYNPTYNNSYDYNNLYTTGTNLVDRGTPATDYANLSDWRIATGHELNSISYDPGFMNATDLHPDPANPASWSLNGRGVHMAGNTLDLDNNARVTLPANGVPDIGAYEFTPTSVPPVAVAIPANPAAGSRQTFTFGYDTVAVVDWHQNSVVPNSIEVRQFTGTKPPQLSVPGFMYFYTDINTQNVTYGFDASIYYKDPWRGTTGTEANLRMVKKLGSNAWQGYNGTESSVNSSSNIISAASLTAMGKFSGTDNNAIFSATIKPVSSTVFCPGGSVVLNANTGTGYTYQWQLNGVDINGATNASYIATAVGDYTVTVKDIANSLTATSDPVSITIIAPPAAQITASGALTYCIGSSLTLSTPSVPGLSYQWQLNGTDIPGATNASYPVNSAGGYSVTVGNIGCASTSSLLPVAAGPLNLSLGTDTTFCESKTALFILDAGHKGATYLWSTGDTAQAISANASGQYWVEVNAGPGCVAKDTIELQVNPLPKVVGISYTRSGDTYDFYPSGATNVGSYLWIFNDGVTSTSMNVTHTFTIPATNVKLVVTNDCGSDTISLQLSLNVKDAAKGNVSLQLYPNPATDNITISVDGGSITGDIAVINNVGQVVYKETEQGNVNIKAIRVDNLPAGHYILRVNTTKGISSKPFIISRQ